MKKIPRLVLRENQILAGTSMGYLVGGYELPEVVVYGYYRHTGDPSECPICREKLPGTDDWDLGKSLYTYGVWFDCLYNKGGY